MTEPDLVTIGDDAAVDDASVVCHINTRGEFSLQPLVLGRGAVLRSHARLMSGGRMGDGALLRENTLTPPGDVLPARTEWQGWPARLVIAPVVKPGDAV